jgi:hypothetical protein
MNDARNDNGQGAMCSPNNSMTWRLGYNAASHVGYIAHNAIEYDMRND